MRGRTIAGSLAFALFFSACAHPRVADSTPSGEVHSTEGTIESFGDGRRFVRIHHETIPGYLRSMTMPFEPGTDTMLGGFEVGDRVVFEFQERDDGRRVLVGIRKR